MSYYELDECDLCGPECPDCSQHEDKMYYASKYLDKIYKMLSSKGPIDLFDLYNNLEEVSGYVGHNNPLVEFNVTRQ